MPKVFDSKGNEIQLDTLIGSGGEGDVFAISGTDQIVAKIYKQQIDKLKADKLQWMASNGSSDLLKFTAWVLEVLKSESGQIVGFLMPRVCGKPIHQLWTPTDRKKFFPHAIWPFLLRAAENLATCFQAVHQANQIIGDVNYSNCFVKTDGTVALIDCDSFSIEADGFTHNTEVATPHYLPPELQGVPLVGLPRTRNHDNFGLAVLIFHLLFLGRHPFTGRYLDESEPTLSENIKGMRFAYGIDSASRGVVPPEGSLELEIASPELIGLFRRAFLEEGLRPTAEEWRRALESLQKKLKVCSLDKTHHYYRELNCCPWCLLPSSTGRATFNSAKYASPSGRFDAIAFSQILGSLKLLEFSGVSNTTFIGEHIQPDGSGRFRTSLLIVVPVSIALSIFLGPYFAALLSCALSGALYARFGRLSRSDKLDLLELEDAKALITEFLRVWEIENKEWELFIDKKISLQNEINRYLNLDNEIKESLESFETTAREIQLRWFLRQFKIKDALEAGEIPGITPQRMQGLSLSGNETATHIEGIWIESELQRLKGPRSLGVTFHDVIANLRKWRAAKEADFVFDPAKASSDKKALARGFVKIRNQIEEDVRWMLPELERRAAELNRRMVEINAKAGLLQERLEDAGLRVMRKNRATFSPTPLLSVSLVIPVLLSCGRC